jgi:DNA mismatch repair protein MutS
MAVKEQGASVIFLRQVIPGGAEKSFGIHVARLAGLPERVVERAEEMLAKLEESRSTTDDRPRTVDDGLQMISRGQVSVVGGQLREERAEYDARIEVWRGILQQLLAIDIANMTPLQALNLLSEMQMVVKESGSKK